MPQVLAGTTVRSLQMGPEASLPDGVALILETGCWGCDGGPTGFLRVYRDPSGRLRTETLLSAQTIGVRRLVTNKEGVQEKQEPYITGLAMKDDASDIVVSVCVREWCGGGGLDAWSADAVTAVFRSLDGGVTWQNLGEIDIGGGIVAPLPDGQALIAVWEAELADAAFRVFPAGQVVSPPGLASHEWPAFTLDGRIVWQPGEGKLVREDGSVFLDLGPGANPYGHSQARQDGGISFSWSWDPGIVPPAGPPLYYLSSIGEDGRLLATSAAPKFLLPGVWLEPGVLIGNTDVAAEELSSPASQFFLGFLPALIDFEAGLIHPIAHPFLDPGYEGGRSLVHAVQRGPFARVTGTGSCLNVRESPSATAPSLACAADGVLLRDTGETSDGDGAWLRVVTPSGLDGWASTAYLER
ncbi:MAG TPA: SH3 domain-containing protein [Dehalococcoidia bacterium]|nr:SH3 domain-containing protein [Dehalococcoidia bacterium]